MSLHGEMHDSHLQPYYSYRFTVTSYHAEINCLIWRRIFGVKVAILHEYCIFSNDYFQKMHFFTIFWWEFYIFCDTLTRISYCLAIFKRKFWFFWKHLEKFALFLCFVCKIFFGIKPWRRLELRATGCLTVCDCIYKSMHVSLVLYYSLYFY